MDKRNKIISSIYKKLPSHINDSNEIMQKIIDILYDVLGVGGEVDVFGGAEEMENYVFNWMSENVDPELKATEQVEESLKYPTKSYARKTTDHARKRSSPVTAESKFADKLSSILDNGDVKPYNLIDESNSEESLYTDLITDEEANNRNNKLVDKKEPFRWIPLNG